MRKIKIGGSNLGSRRCWCSTQATLLLTARGTAGNAGCVTSAWSQSGPKATITIFYYEGVE